MRCVYIFCTQAMHSVSLGKTLYNGLCATISKTDPKVMLLLLWAVGFSQDQ